MLPKIFYFVTLICLTCNICLSQNNKDSVENDKDSLITIKVINVTDSGKVYSEIKEPLNFVGPFGPITYFSFNVINTSDVNLLICNNNGDLLFSVTEEKLSAGKYRMYFIDEIKNFPSGTYFYQIKTNGKNFEMKKIILMK